MSVEKSASELASLKSQFYDFPIFDYCLRYLCGGGSLREFRDVSRFDLLLAKIGMGTTQATQLNEKIIIFNRCIGVFVQGGLSKDSLFKSHAVVMSLPSSRFRKSPAWCGKSQSESIYPKTDNAADIDKSIRELTSHYSAQYDHNLSSSINTHMKLLQIHPFSDGNGRVARAFILGEEEKYGILISPLLFLLQEGARDLYVKDAHSRYREERQDAGNQIFWNVAYDWSVYVTNEIQYLIKSAKKQLDLKLANIALSNLEKALVQKLWKQPIVNETVLKTLSQSEDAIVEAVTNLLSIGVIQPTQIAKFKDEPLFHCQILINLYKHIESALFQPWKGTI